MNDAHSFEQARRSIITAGQRIWRQGWCPATSSNFSQRLDDERCAITVSGRDKGALQEADIMQVDMQGQSLDGQKPSAETLLHTQLYRRDNTIAAVLHTHSVKATLVSMHANDTVSWQGLELLKAFQGTDSHEASLTIPVFNNTQDIAALAGQVERRMSVHGTGVAYLIRGHGLYTWGCDMAQAMRHLEALEFLLDYYWQILVTDPQAVSTRKQSIAGDAKA